jgi:hypothetical protein
MADTPEDVRPADDYAEYASIIELEEPRVKQPLCQPHLSTCAARGCDLPVLIPPIAFRRDHYCPKHQILFSITKKLARHGYGLPKFDVIPWGPGAQPKTPMRMRGNPGRASKKGIWKAAEEIWGKARAAGFNAPPPPQVTSDVQEQAA